MGEKFDKKSELENIFGSGRVSPDGSGYKVVLDYCPATDLLDAVTTSGMQITAVQAGESGQTLYIR